MALVPQSWQAGGITGGNRGYTGFSLYDNEPDLARLQGNYQSSMLSKQLQERLQESQLGAATQTHQADIGAANDRAAMLQGADTARRGQDVGLQTAQMQNDTARHGQDLQLQASMAPVNFARDKFNSVFPLIQSQLGTGSQGSQVQFAPQPGITTGGVWSDQQVNEQANAQRAGIDQQTASRQKQAASSAAGRGFSANSPLVQALQAQIGNQGMASAADAERNVRWDAAQGNAQQNLASQQAAEQQWADLADAQVRNSQASTQRTSALLQALASLAS